MLEFVDLPLILEFAMWLLFFIGVAVILPWKDETGEGNDWSTCLGMLIMMGISIGFLIYLNS